jgi:transposase InsO family protein
MAGTIPLLMRIRVRKRQTTWHAFLKAHWEVLASVDFTTIDVWMRSGLVTYLLFLMELATRRVHLAGITANPDERWMLQIARNATDEKAGFLYGKKYLLIDRDDKFSEAFRATLEGGGVKPVCLPPRSPKSNSNIERFMRSVKEECLERRIFFGKRSLQGAAGQLAGPFSHGEKPPRARQSAHRTGRRSWSHKRRGRVLRETGWCVSILLPKSSVAIVLCCGLRLARSG